VGAALQSVVTARMLSSPGCERGSLTGMWVTINFPSRERAVSFFEATSDVFGECRGTLPVVDAQLQKYAQKLRARLRDGAAARVCGNIKAPQVPRSVAALVTARAVADMFANGAACDYCAVCERGLQHATMSLQLVGFTEASVTLAPMCTSCAVGAKKAKTARTEDFRTTLYPKN